MVHELDVALPWLCWRHCRPIVAVRFARCSVDVLRADQELLCILLPKKVSSVEIERVIMEAVPAVAEVAAVGIPARGGGPELLHLFVVPKGSTDGSSSSGGGGASEPAALQKACQAALRAHLNPLFKVEALLLRQTLPRTASNKVMRRVMRDQVVAAQAPRARM